VRALPLLPPSLSRRRRRLRLHNITNIRFNFSW
jgi:hypothetical protein